MHASKVQAFSTGEGLGDLTAAEALEVLGHRAASNLPPEVRARLIKIGASTPQTTVAEGTIVEQPMPNVAGPY